MTRTDFPSQTQRTCGDASTCAVHGAQVESMNRVHAAEVLSLRQRIEVLEQALAVARMAQRSSPTAPVADDLPHCGAEGWDDGEASFAERVAAREFFRDEAIDEPSRRWFLQND